MPLKYLPFHTDSLQVYLYLISPIVTKNVM